MSSFRRLGYKNHPAISSELVKFLAINTGFEAIEQAVLHVATLSAEMVEVKKLVAAATKSSISAANKADETKKLVDGLQKRVAKLESK